MNTDKTEDFWLAIITFYHILNKTHAFAEAGFF